MLCFALVARSSGHIPGPHYKMLVRSKTRFVPAGLLLAVYVTQASAFCCFWAPVKDKCSKCGAKAASSNWCAKSAKNCAVCTGTWCAGGSAVKPRTPPKTSVKKLRWITGTWTTGYWDCCKPSCSWKGKGSVNAPVRSCSARTGQVLKNSNVRSVCLGGDAAACVNQQPWRQTSKLSYGFAAAAVSGKHGLKGDANCGQCYALKFTSQVHPGGNWGGSHPKLVGHTMIVQVTNIGYDVNGDHSFDLQIPGAGQGAFSSGCRRQFPGKSVDDFDCGKRYGGCNNKSGCRRLPKALQKGCNWRYDTYHWLKNGGKTNNPYVKFARVRCPRKLTAISGSVPLDDKNYPMYP